MTLLQLLVVIILFPLVVILLTEVYNRLRRRGKGYATSVALLRNFVLPLVAIYLLVVYAAEVPQDGLLVKLFLTGGIIMGLVAVLGILNGVLFENEAGSRVPKLFLDLGRILVVFLGVAVVINLVWGYDLNNLITALGVSSIVLGLALQDTLGNLFNGITLINERPFRVGDFIEVDGMSGEVVEINWRAIRLLTRERDLIVLPHLKVAQSAIMNHSQPEEHWAQKLVLGFSYDNPPNLVKEAMLETLLATPGVLHTPPPEVKVDDFADSSVNYEIEYYIPSFGEREEVRDAFMSRVWYVGKRFGLEIPFPQLTLHQYPQQDAHRQTTHNRAEELRFALSLLQLDTEYDNLATDTGVHFLHHGRGELVLQPARPAPGLYFILRGEIRLTARDRDNDIVEMALLHRGDLFTEIMLRGQRRNAVTATATTDVTTLHIDEDLLRRLVNRYPTLANRVDQIITNRRRQLAKVMAS